ncbi:MAG: hypothetical protein H0U70_05120 [Tatlockia sp.]|nr:hypothetical protein [Tatlockia sp.]
MTINPKTPSFAINSNHSAPFKNDEISLLESQGNGLELLAKGKKIVITENELKQLLKSNSNQALTSFSLALYGLKSAKDLCSFLKSPLDEKERKMMQVLLVLILAFKIAQGQDAIRAELLKHLFFANLKLVKFLKRKAAVKELNLAYQHQIEKSLAFAKAEAQQRLDQDDDLGFSNDNLYNQLIVSHALTPLIIEELLKAQLEEAQLLEQEIADHEKLFAEIIERHNILTSHLEGLDDHSAMLETLQKPGEKIEITQEALGHLQKRITETLASIQQHLSRGDEFQANLAINRLDGLQVQALGMKTMLAVLNSEKNFYDAKGQPTDSYRKAEFIVSNQIQLYKDKQSGKFYLLKPGQDFSSLTVDEKVEAQRNYEDSKPETTILKEQIKLQRVNEIAFFEEKKSALLLRSEFLQKNILDLNNKYNDAKTAEANGLELIKEPLLNPVPTPGPRNQNVIKPQLSLTQSYKQVLNLLRYNPTTEAINRLKSSFLLINGQPNQAAQNAVSQAIRPGEIILPAKMNSLLSTLERLGVSANKPNVTSIPNKHPKPQNKPAPYSSPTPFKTTPSPFKF